MTVDETQVRTAYYVLAIIGLLSSGAWWYVSRQRARIAKLHARIDQLERVMVTADTLTDAISDVIARFDRDMKAHLERDNQRWRDHLEWGAEVTKRLEAMTAAVEHAVVRLEARIDRMG